MNRRQRNANKMAAREQLTYWRWYAAPRPGVRNPDGVAIAATYIKAAGVAWATKYWDW